MKFVMRGIYAIESLSSKFKRILHKGIPYSIEEFQIDF